MNVKDFKVGDYMILWYSESVLSTSWTKSSILTKKARLKISNITGTVIDVITTDSIFDKLNRTWAKKGTHKFYTTDQTEFESNTPCEWCNQ